MICDNNRKYDNEKSTALFNNIAVDLDKDDII